MKEQINKLIEVIKADYAKFMNKDTEVQKQMREDFNNSIKVLYGSKYIKIVKDGSVWGFIVNTDSDKKFRKGDILKPAGYKTPARNAARGNILDGGYSISWTGPFYLK